MWWRPASRCKRQACTPSENQSCTRRRCWYAARTAPSRRRANKAAEVLIQRLRGVLIARQYVMMDYNCPTAALPAAREITPGMESPTVAPLQEEGWVAVRAMVLRNQAQAVMDRLWAVGARAILVTSLEACRL
ncbi:MAG: ATP phosphoribosyltransferase, partial [Pseudonocardiaceae bacterium]